MTDDDRIRALIFAVDEWRTELAEIEKCLEGELTREQRLTLEGDRAIMMKRISRGSGLTGTCLLVGFLSHDREWFAREVGESLAAPLPPRRDE